MLTLYEAMCLAVSILWIVIEVMEGNVSLVGSSLGSWICIEEMVLQCRDVATSLHHAIEVTPTYTVHETAALSPHLELLLLLDCVKGERTADLA